MKNEAPVFHVDCESHQLMDERLSLYWANWERMRVWASSTLAPIQRHRPSFFIFQQASAALAHSVEIPLAPGVFSAFTLQFVSATITFWLHSSRLPTLYTSADAHTNTLCARAAGGTARKLHSMRPTPNSAASIIQEAKPCVDHRITPTCLLHL